MKTIYTNNVFVFQLCKLIPNLNIFKKCFQMIKPEVIHNELEFPAARRHLIQAEIESSQLK